MKRSILVPLGFSLLGAIGLAGCPVDPGTGGVGTGGSNPAGTGGSMGSGGMVVIGTGGSGSGGMVVIGTGGSSSGGSTGSGGSSSGGSIGSGGAASGGAIGSGGMGMAGRGAAGSGMAGRGAAGSGMAGRAGTGGAGTGGVAPGLPTIPELFPASGTLGSLDGRLLLMPCGEANAGGTDCASGGGYYATAGSTAAPLRVNCSGGAFTLQQDFAVGGEANRQYNVTVHFYGVAEPKNYGSGLTREATARPAATPTGAGATPTPWAEAAGGHTFPVSAYNTNEIHVRNMAGAEQRVYYLNADTSEGHWSYVMNYEKNIVVWGGGTVRVRNYDQNCREIKNCGPSGTAATACAAASNARVVNVSAAMPTPANAGAAMGGLSQPGLVPERDAGSAGQWLLIDIVRINSVM